MTVRWFDSVQYATIGTSDAVVLAIVASVFEQIPELTRVPTSRVDLQYTDAKDYLASLSATPRFDPAACDRETGSDCANFVILVTDNNTIQEIAEAVPLRSHFQHATAEYDQLDCFFSPGISTALHIERGFVYINEELDSSLLSACLHEEIYQSFGLFNDYSESIHFSFNNVVAQKHIRSLDKSLLESLYSDKFQSAVLVDRVVDFMIEELL